MQQHSQSVSKVSSRYIALEEGLKQFSLDLNKLEVITEPLSYQALTNTGAAIRRSERNSILQDLEEGKLTQSSFAACHADVQ